MNKRLFLLIPFISTALLSGCKPFRKKSSNSSSYSQEFVGGDLIFSEFIVGDVYSNRALEIANVGNEELDLSKYHINIYNSFDFDEIYHSPSHIIDLLGRLEPHKTFVIAYGEAKQSIIEKADLISFEFLNDGTFPMTIVNENDEIVDCLGYFGYFYDTAHMSDAVRKIEKLKASQYSPYDWIRYPSTCLSNLGNLDCPANDELIEGPKLTSEDFSKPYVNSEGQGGGGAIEVSLSSTIDGDTTRFNYGTSLAEYGISGVNPMRYYGINTPEIAHGDNPADPYGPEAQAFTNSLLKKAKHFVVQSVSGYSLTETYGRMLGYVWVSDKTSPSPSDYYLLNHYILLNGYARVGYIDRGGYNDYMLYQGISYVEYLYDAQQYAILHKLHIYEEGL